MRKDPTATDRQEREVAERVAKAGEVAPAGKAPKVVDLRGPAIGVWIITAAFVLLAVFGCASRELTTQELAALPPDTIIGMFCPVESAGGMTAYAMAGRVKPGCRAITAGEELEAHRRAASTKVMTYNSDTGWTDEAGNPVDPWSDLD